MISVCQYGDIYELVPTVFDIEFISSLLIDASWIHTIVKYGYFIVGFKEEKHAIQCAKRLHQTNLGGRILSCLAIPKSTYYTLDNESQVKDMMEIDSNIKTDNQVEIKVIPSSSLSNTQQCNEIEADVEEIARKEAESVEDFLNSLL
jgi:hypothetical protein